MKVIAIAVTMISVVILGLGIAAVSGAIEGPGWYYVMIGGLGAIFIPARLIWLGKEGRRVGVPWTRRQVKLIALVCGALTLTFGIGGGAVIAVGEVGKGVGLLIIGAGAIILGFGCVRELRRGYGL